MNQEEWREKVREQSADAEKEIETPVKIVETSFVVADGKMYEQVFDKENGVRYAMWDGVTVEYVDSVFDNGTIYRPINDINALRKSVVVLPERPEEYGTDEELITAIRAFVHRWLDVSPEFETIIVYSIPFSWVYDRFTTLHYLGFRGDFGVGKSRGLETVGRIFYKPTLIAGAVTSAPIFRLIDMWKGSIIVDEGDLVDSSITSDVIKILNCGFERGRPILRCNGDKGNQVEAFETFGPKILSTRRPYKDKALESRCVTEIMKETNREDIPDTVTHEFYAEQMKLRNKLLLFRFRRWFAIDPAASAKIDLRGVERRIRQIMRGVLATLDKKIALEFVRIMKGFQEKLIEERSGTFEGMIVNAIFELQDSGKEDIAATDIGEKMVKMFSFKEHPDNRLIGRYLRTLHIETKQTRLDDKNLRCIVWDEALMKNLKRKFVVASVATVASVSKSPFGHCRDGKQKHKATIRGLLDTHDTIATDATKTEEVLNFIDVYDGKKEAEVKEKFEVDDKFLDNLKRIGLAFEVLPGRIQRC